MNDSKVKMALLATGSNEVSNIIIANSDYSQEGFTAQVIASGVFCEAGMYYNDSDSLYYQDADFTVIFPYATDFTLPVAESNDTASS